MASLIDTVRLSLHVLAATIWVGGQFTLAALLPVLRSGDPELPGKAARAFNRIAWPAFGILIATGIWNMAAVSDDPKTHTTSYMVVMTLKLVAVAASGLAAWAHIKATSKKALAIFGAVGGLSAILAVIFGVALAG